MGHINMQLSDSSLLKTLLAVLNNIIIIIARCPVGMQGLPGHIWLQPYRYNYHHHLQDDHDYMLSNKPAGPAKVCTDTNLQPDLAPEAQTCMQLHLNTLGAESGRNL